MEEDPHQKFSANLSLCYRNEQTCRLRPDVIEFALVFQIFFVGFASFISSANSVNVLRRK